MPEPEKTAPINPEPVDQSADKIITITATERQPREISQTDHINKKLLTSLFNRINDGDSQLSKMLEADTNTDEEQDWD